MKVDEPQPEEQAKQVANCDTEEQKKKLSEPRWQTAKLYLLPENSCLPFLTFLIKFCLGKKSNLSYAQVTYTSDNRLIPMTTYLRILL